MIPYLIPFNKPAYIPESEAYVSEALKSGHLSGDGPFTKRCHTLIQQITGAPKALLTTNCTHALEMAAILLDLKPGDEVIVPSFTFVSTVNAFVLRGAKPIFIDIRPDTLNIDETQLEALITPRTKAIFVVHYAGVGCEMDVINAVALKHNIPVVEDNAHGLFAKYKGKNLGTFGALATQSFHETKNVSSGEGGALLINDPIYNDRAEIIREKGTNRSRFFRGQVDKYTWVDVGSSYLPSELVAALLCAQLEAGSKIQAKRKSICTTYRSELATWAEKLGATLPYVPEYCEEPSHMFYLLMPDLDTRTRFIQWMKSQNVLCVFHYLPLHLSDMGLTFGGKPGDCPVTEDISDRLVRLPLYYDLMESELAYVIETIHAFAG
ncbi:MAG TPA: dTDP-4-amino-4,6-dideoxygalactose transaminase [Anaerolineaceae bacterium]|nr:dTDP-4-amino-4,6-dideoxygalactose transaminase [Anaerolineaceae bacterium]